MDDIKRTTAPETKNGSQWEVQLSAIPAPGWLELFKSGGSSVTALWRRFVFDRNTIFFRCGAEHVETWIQSMDKLIETTNGLYNSRLEQASLARATREDSQTREAERIRQLNERFKNL